ncbi:MAG: ABC transporter permease [candidate division Zixibacteria bacterium]|nr:ABC transporter permease [candidate division Zixibacteria bacterium]
MTQPNEVARFWQWKWLFVMAWRDSRTHRRRLLLYVSSIILGTAALVAIRSLADSMELTVNLEAKSLLGADLSVSSGQPFPQPVRDRLDSLGGERSLQMSFSSMLVMPRTESSRLVQVRALEGGYPFYGILETNPSEAAQTFRKGPFALVDEGLMIQYALSVGDTVRLGASSFVIAGRLLKIPGETVAMSAIGPRVYIPMDRLEATQLIQPGSRVNYRAYFRFSPDRDVETLAVSLRSLRAQYFVNTETVEDRKRQVGRSLSNLYGFLNLGGFIALILGSVGVASAVNTYVRQKLATVAILRCLGADARQTFTIYLIQAVGMGLAGSLAGVATGIAVLYAVPAVLPDFVPFVIEVRFSWLPVLQGMGIGLLMAVLFSLLPLLPVRCISPLHALISAYEPEGRQPRDPWRILIFIVLAAWVIGFGVSQTRHPGQGLAFAGGLIGAFLLLNLVARGVIRLVRWVFPDSWGYLWRQGLANLFRPNNQTVTLIVALGLGAFLLTTLFLLQYSLLENLALAGSGDQPNMVIFDVQTDQKEPLQEIMAKNELKPIQQVPVVAMRIASLKGRTAEEIRSDTTGATPRWLVQREYRSTYREHLTDTETLIEGHFTGRASPAAGLPPVSIEEDVAYDLSVALGDTIGFDVQGIRIDTVVGSIRKVNWQRVQPNFFVVFPAGVLEEAPQFHVMVTRIDDPTTSARFQREVIRALPNVSMIDLQLIMSTVDAILDKVALVVRFMALFSVFTGVIVLIGVITNSRYQRVQESVLLKTLGGTRRQVMTIMVLEYVFLGSIAATTGVLLAMAATWGLAVFLFEIAFTPVVFPLIAIVLGVVAVTLTVGLWAGRGIHNRPPLAVLRSEV